MNWTNNQAGHGMAQAPNQPVRILRLPEVMKRTGLGRSTTYALIQKNSHPLPVPLGERAVGFVEAEIEAFLLQRIANRDRRLGSSSPGFG